MTAASTSLRCGDFVVDLAVPRVMGIVNVTPDSFSDGGVAFATSAAVGRAHRLVEEGADLVDVGAESTRPGSQGVDAETEWSRLGPVLAGLRDLAVPLSVDTRHASTMRRALDAGVSMINDVTAFRSPGSLDAIRDSSCAACAMHMRGTPATMQQEPTYDDVVGEVSDFLRSRADALVDAGVSADRIVLDPGFGFGKALAHNVALLASLSAIVDLGHPVLVGLSRKGMIGALTGRPVEARLPGSVAAALLAVERGARIVRAHDVAATADALRIWRAVRAAGGAGASIRPR